MYMMALVRWDDYGDEVLGIYSSLKVVIDLVRSKYPDANMTEATEQHVTLHVAPNLGFRIEKFKVDAQPQFRTAYVLDDE